MTIAPFWSARCSTWRACWLHRPLYGDGEGLPAELDDRGGDRAAALPSEADGRPSAWSTAKACAGSSVGRGCLALAMRVAHQSDIVFERKRRKVIQRRSRENFPDSIRESQSDGQAITKDTVVDIELRQGENIFHYRAQIGLTTMHIYKQRQRRLPSWIRP